MSVILQMNTLTFGLILLGVVVTVQSRIPGISNCILLHMQSDVKYVYMYWFP